jgi:hypothetical protein
MIKILRNVFVLFFVGVVNFSFSQKLYVWCPTYLPEIELENDILNGSKIDVIIKDTRITTKKSKIKCLSESIQTSIIELIALNFPKSQVQLIDESKMDKSTARIIIMIEMNNYNSHFSSPLWYGQTGFDVKIINRFLPDNQTKSKDIYWIAREQNTLGTNSGKIALQNSFEMAANDLIRFIYEISNLIN